LFSGACLNKLLACGAQCLRIAQFKGSTRLGAFLPETGNRADFQNVMLVKKLDDGQSPKKEDCIS
jgi:hypothetical protein